MEGQGGWEWGAAVEGKLGSGQEGALVGGGSSAGQAAVFLSAHVAKVWMLVRGPGLAASMSKYLIDRIASIPNIELRTRTEIVSLTGEPGSGIESITWRHHVTKVEEKRPIRNVFLFLGADPAAQWLAGCKRAVDNKRFVTTRSDPRLPVETTRRA